MIYCRNCAKFTFHVDRVSREAFKGYQENVHGWCKGGLLQPPHIEHNESIRCLSFVSKQPETVRESWEQEGTWSFMCQHGANIDDCPRCNPFEA